MTAKKNGPIEDLLVHRTKPLPPLQGRRWVPGQQDLFPYQTLVERMRALQYAMCRRTLDDRRASRNSVESALAALEDMLKEMPS